MKTVFKHIDIVPTGNIPELDRINIDLRNLILTIEGTLPGSRGFGLSGDYLDQPVNEAANELAVELQEKADIYLPEITVQKVLGSNDLAGGLSLAIHIGGREQE